MIRLRRTWFQVHKWLGIALANLIIPISLTGAALVWHDWLDEQINPQRYPAVTDPLLAPSTYARSATGLLKPGESITIMKFPGERGSVRATVTKPSAVGGRPQRATVWLEPKTAQPIERAGGRDGLLQVMHVLHGSLMMPGVGRQIVGWVGAAMLLSSLTGLWLWWPIKRGFVSGLRWRRRPDLNSNLHHQAGFWVALPLAVLSATGVWISFPAVFSGGGTPPGAPAPLAQPHLTPDRALAAAQILAPGRLTSIAWPTDKKAEWTVSLGGSGASTDVKVADAEGTASIVPPKHEPFARTMRRIHDGTGMPLLWRIIIFVGGILPALLAVTGILMWLRTRARRVRHCRGTRPVEAGALAN